MKLKDLSVEELCSHLYKQDPKIREELILRFQALVKSLASRFQNSNESLEDLIQVGNIGLINAIDRFEPKREVKIITYATSYILGEIKRHFRDNSWNIKIPRHLYDFKQRLNKISEKEYINGGQWPSVQKLAELTGYSELDINEALCLDFPILTSQMDHSGGVDFSLNLDDVTGETDKNIEFMVKFEDLRLAVAMLSEKKKTIVALHHFANLPLVRIAKILHLSYRCAENIYRKSLQDLRKNLLIINGEFNPSDSQNAEEKLTNVSKLLRECQRIKRKERHNRLYDFPIVPFFRAKVALASLPGLIHYKSGSIDFKKLANVLNKPLPLIRKEVLYLKRSGVFSEQKRLVCSPGRLEVRIIKGLCHDLNLTEEIILQNGSIYNLRDLSDELLAKNIPWASQTDVVKPYTFHN